jgi:hypothetical protein
LADKGGVAHNPQGPDSPFDPAEPDEKKRVHRGGSFLCNDQYCSRYIVGTRGKGEVSTGTNHLGFRCVKYGETPNRQNRQVSVANWKGEHHEDEKRNCKERGRVCMRGADGGIIRMPWNFGSRFPG